MRTKYTNLKIYNMNYLTNEYFSNCCGAAPLYNNIDIQRCSDCKENCEFIYE